MWWWMVRTCAQNGLLQGFALSMTPSLIALACSAWKSCNPDLMCPHGACTIAQGVGKPHPTYIFEFRWGHILQNVYPWLSMTVHYYPLISMDIRGWICMDTHSYPISMNMHVCPGYPWIFIDNHCCPWIAMDSQS